jgi:two-component system sensor histidine kinase/response regulator
VVDDREENRLLIRELFDTAQYRVLEAPDGDAALRIAEELRPDCILLDLDMPGMDGFEVLDRLQEDPRTREIPVVILTALDASLEHMERALSGGAVDYLTKPISPLHVAIRVRGAIDRSRLLREVQELRSAFTSMLVHDLRAPLTVLTTYIDFLRQETAGPVTDVQQRYLEKMEASCGRMIGLIEDILDLSRLEAGKLRLEREPLDLAGLAADVAERFAPLAAQKGIELAVRHGDAEPAVVLGDQNRLEQVLMNLFSNALKFTPAAGSIVLDVRRVEKEVEVSVRDSGPGIPRAEQSLLFERFSQPPSLAATGARGSGLGLVICRHLVEAHGGRIWVESQPGQGSCFAFRLPRAR